MRFGILFELRLRHDYWLNIGATLHEALPANQQARMLRALPVSDWIAVVPTTDTRRALAGHGMVFRATAQGCLVGIELEGQTNAPRRPLGAGERLRFGLAIRDPRFTSVTGGATRAFHVFGNTPGNARGGELHLSQPVAVFDTTRRYLAGELRALNQGAETRLFQARRDTGPAASPVAADWQRIPAETHNPSTAYVAGSVIVSNDHLFRALVNGPGADLTNATDWDDLGPLANQYVTHDDRMTLRPPVFSLDVQAAAANVLEARVRRPGGPTIRVQRFASPDPLNSVPIDLSGLAEDTYVLDLHDASGAALPAFAQTFYLSAEASAAGWFGVIEIDPGIDAFALLDAGGNLRSPVFDLRFAALAARLRYRFAAPQPVGAGAEVAPDPADASILLSNALRPITRRGTGPLLRADDAATPAVIESILLPHPAPSALRKEAGEWLAEMYISNLPPLT